MKNSEFRIGLAPEGTRAKVDKLRTGFYHIAKQGKCPDYYGDFRLYKQSKYHIRTFLPYK